jgi:hypothetical protein
MTDLRFEAVHLGLTLWEGTFEDQEATWLRWCDDSGTVIQTGGELAKAQTRKADSETARANAEGLRADAERERADAERERADAERARADAERARAEKLETRLKALGIDTTE